MTEDINPARESGPEVLKISSRKPVAAEEEKSFAKMTGRTSFGIFKRFPRGARNETIRSSAPDERKIWIAKNKAIKVGAISNTILNPSITPSRNGV